MPVGLSYPGLRCVLEHLDAVKRIHIASRSAALQRCEKSIPLRLNYLQISSVVTCLEYFHFRFSGFPEMELEFATESRYWRRIGGHSVPQNLETTRTVEDKINQYYMGGRASVYVKSLEVSKSVSSALPMDKMFKITELDAYNYYFEDYLPIIDPISFPLKYLRTTPAGLHTYDHPVFRSAEILSIELIEEKSEAEMICLHKLPCKTVLFDECHLNMLDVVSMIRYWMEHPKEIGTKYTFLEWDFKLVHAELDRIKEAFKEVRQDLEETTVNGTRNWPRFLIQLNPNSKLHIYTTGSFSQHCYFIIKVVPESGAEFSEIEEPSTRFTLV